jgi:hypothetical protein
MAGLFDYQSPENMRAARLQPLLVSGAQMGQQPLLSQLVSQMSNAGANLGSAGAGMLGLQLPEEAAQQRVKDIMQGVAQDDVEGLKAASQKFADIGDTQRAQALMGQANKVADSAYVQTKRDSETKVRDVIAETLRNKPDATSEELSAAIAPFTNNPTAVIETRAKAETAQLENSNRVSLAREKAADALQRVREQGANRLAIAAEGNKNRLFMLEIANRNKKELQEAELESKTMISAAQASARKDLLTSKITADREAAAAKQNTAVLPPSLQKVENENLASIDSFTALAKILDEPIKSLKGTATKPPLDLGPAAVIKYVTLNSTGNSTEASRAYSALQESVAQAVNIQVGAETGVQTKDDVVRFASALVAASSKTDTVATREALVRFQDAINVKATAAKRNVNSQRASQNISPYFPDVKAAPGTNPGTRGAPNNTSNAGTVSWGALK